MKNFINLNNSNWLQVIFAHRNQEYGAYVLRKNNNRNHQIAFTAIILLSSIIWLSYGIYMHYKPIYVHPLQNQGVVKIINIDLGQQPKIKPPTEKKIEERKSTKTQRNTTPTTKTVQQSRWLNPKVVNQPLHNLTPTINDLKKSTIGEIDIKGLSEIGNEANHKSHEKGLVKGENTDTENEQNIFNDVEIYPEFLGGTVAWARFLNDNLTYPSEANESGISGKVILQFVIEKNGRLSDIKVIKSLHKTLDEAAIQALMKSPRWRPGFQNGLPVRVRYRIPISFNINR